MSTPRSIEDARPKLEAITGGADASDEMVPSSPAPLAEEAFWGIVGEITRQIEPHTESSPAAVLVQVLVMLGNALGRGPHVRVEADRHGGNLYVVIVGETARSRKGTSRAQAQRPVELADEKWAKACITGGLSSGEGLIHAVRDEVMKTVNGEEVIADPGVEDKRLLVVESEFASTLRVMGRDGSTLSAVVRQAWDGNRLAVLSKNTGAAATDAHVSIISHITRDELRRELSSTDQSNGFANRFLFVHAARSKLLPEGGNAHTIDWAPLVRLLDVALDQGRVLRKPVARDPAARKLWAEVYPQLTAGHLGMLGAITSRAEAQVTRIALIHAALECSKTITVEHLQAALALWTYSEESARYIFGSSLGDADADAILRALIGAAEGGLSRTQISGLFKGHKPADQIDRALTVLQDAGRARCERTDTGGRPSERWIAT